MAFSAIRRSLHFGRPSNTPNLTPRNADLLNAYIGGEPASGPGERDLPQDHYQIARLYKIIPTRIRRKGPGVWFFDITNAGDALLDFLGRKSRFFHVHECSLAGAEEFWRDDIVRVMETGQPVSGRFVVYVGDNGYISDDNIEVEHLALPIASRGNVREIVGGFDIVDGRPLCERRIDWSAVIRTHRLRGPQTLRFLPNKRRIKPQKKSGRFNAFIDQQFFSTMNGSSAHKGADKTDACDLKVSDSQKS